MITIKEIAKILGVSHSTVSRALNDHPSISQKTKTKIQQEAEKLGYIVNQAANTMKGNSTNSIGLLIPDIDNAFYSRLTSILTELFQKDGTNVILSVTQDDYKQEEDAIRHLLSLRSKAILFVPSPNISDISLKLLKNNNGIQLIRRIEKEPSIGYVGIDDYQSVSNAVNKLYLKNINKIAYIGPTTMTSSGSGRLMGFIDTCNKFNITHSIVTLSSKEYAKAKDEAKNLLENEGFNNLILGGEVISQATWSYIQKSKYMNSKDLNIINFGNFEWSKIMGCNNKFIDLPLENIARSCYELVNDISKIKKSNIQHLANIVELK